MLCIARDLDRVLAALRAGRLKVRMPHPAGLFRRTPRTTFHPTPELFVQTGGGTDFECPDEAFRLRTWEVCVMPAGLPHAENPVDLRTPYSILVLMSVRDGFLLHRAVASPGREITASQIEHLASPRGRGAFRYLEDMQAPVPAKHRRHYRSGLLEAFLITLLGELDRPSSGEASRSPLVAGAEKIVRALLTDPELSVVRIAAALGCSADYLSRRFQQERGATLTGWVARERIAMARDLLPDPKRSVAEIGWMCGFASASYFIRVFRQLTGVTPKTWRATQ